jgi:hypothetical protein
VALGLPVTGGIKDVERRAVEGRPPRLVLQLQGKKKDMRWRFGHLDDDKKHDRQCSPAAGDRRECDASGRVDEMVSASET